VLPDQLIGSADCSAPNGFWASPSLARPDSNVVARNEVAAFLIFQSRDRRSRHVEDQRVIVLSGLVVLGRRQPSAAPAGRPRDGRSRGAQLLPKNTFRPCRPCSSGSARSRDRTGAGRRVRHTRRVPCNFAGECLLHQVAACVGEILFNLRSPRRSSHTSATADRNGRL
jgi:hypothetical protein